MPVRVVRPSLPVGPQCGAVGPRASSRRAERPAEGAVRAVGHHQVGRADRQLLAQRGTDHGSTDQAALDDRFDRFVALEQLGAGGHGMPCELLVEHLAPDGPAHRRSALTSSPVDGASTVGVGEHHTVDPVRWAEVEAERLDGLDGRRRQRVATRLGARERSAFDHDHPVPLLRQVARSSAACRAGSDDEDVGDDGHGAGTLGQGRRRRMRAISPPRRGCPHAARRPHRWSRRSCRPSWRT